MKLPGQSTVEPVFGSLTQFYGLRKIGVPGKAGAHKVMPVAAIAFNLKKYLKKGGGKEALHWHFQDNYGCLPKLPDHFSPANPTKTGPLKGSVNSLLKSISFT